jgi:endonuclease III
MKNSRSYSQRLEKVLRSLEQKFPKVEKARHEDPAEALVHATVTENMSDSAAQGALKRMWDYFVDLNDLRVSRQEEIVEVLGPNSAEARETASKINSILWSIFRKYNTVSLELLKKMSKRPARQMLEKMEGVSHFAVNYCMLTSLGGHAIPLTKGMLEYLRASELVHPEATEEEIEGFLTRQISAAKAYEFYRLVRQESESGAVTKKPARKQKKK